MNMPELRYDANGLIPAIVQDDETNDVLMLGWMSDESLRMTYDKGLVTFWSRSRQELWTKGETSGDYLELVKIDYDCDQDALLVRARMKGSGVCHTGERTCFYRTI